MQGNYNFGDIAGVAFRQQLNILTEAIATNNSGPTPPETTYPHQFWADTTAGILKRRNAANTAWISVIGLTQSLINVDNTSDEDKPISTATAEALNTIIENIPGIVESSSPKQINGLVVTNNLGDLEHDIDISPGQYGSTKLEIAFTKRLDETFSAGTGNGGMIGSLPASGVVYIFLIVDDETDDVDVYAETTNGTNPPVGWSIVKRIAARITDASSNLQRALVTGNGALLTVFPYTPSVDWNVATVALTRQAYPIGGVLSCPPLVVCNILQNLLNTNSGRIFMTSLLQADVTPTDGVFDVGTFSGTTAGQVTKNVLVDNNRQVGIKRQGADISTSYAVSVVSWVEDRS